jgi:GT2 family glycosyltransferase
MMSALEERGLPASSRELRLGAAPTISVVVASCRQRALLDACLASLLGQAAAHGAELVVARAGGDGEIEELQRDFPTVRVVGAPHDATVPELRAAGMAAAEGDIVALTEDHCLVSEDWLAQMLRAQRGGADVVGGAMDNAQRRRAVDWAAYFAEYGFFSEAENRGAGAAITGANVTYSRRVLEEVIRWARQGEWENVAHSRLAAQGSAMQFVRTAAVYQNQNYRFRDFCRDRFEHGLGYARRRLVDEGTARRWLYLPGTVALPGVLLMRVARAAGREKRGPFLRSLPFTLAFLVSWSFGEAVGYLRGPARRDREDDAG